MLQLRLSTAEHVHHCGRRGRFQLAMLDTLQQGTRLSLRMRSQTDDEFTKLISRRQGRVCACGSMEGRDCVLYLVPHG